MPKRYPEYQGGGMPSQMPTDIQRLIKRMLEAKTDRAEEVIPDMAYGGIVGLQGGGMPPSSGTAATTRALLEFAKRGGLSDQDRLMMDFERMMEDSVERLGYRDYGAPTDIRSIGPRNRRWNDEISRLTLQRLLGREVPEELIGAVSEVQQEFPTRRFIPDEWEGLQDAGRQQEQRRSGIIGFGGPIMRSGGVVGFQAGGVMEALRNIPRGMLDVPRRAIEGIRERIPEGIRELISGDRFGEPGVDVIGPSKYPIGPHARTVSLDEERRGIIPLLLDRIRGRAGGGVVGFQAGGSPYQQRMVQSYVSPEVAQPYADLTSRIQQVGAQPYTPYGGQRLAATTGDQALARAAYGAYGRGAGPAGTQQAAGTMGQAGQMLGGAYQGMAGLQPQYAQMAGQFGTQAEGALGQAQLGATGMQQLAGRAERQGQLAGAGMRATGTAGQLEQQRLGTGQAAAGTAAQAQQQQLGAEQERRGAVAQTQMQGLGQQAQQAGQAALGAQQQFGTGITGMGTAAQTAGQTAQTAMGATGVQSQAQAKSAAERMRTLGGKAPELGKGADLSQYMSQYTAGVTDPQLQQLMEFQRMQGQELGSQAAQAGAFGGTRQGVQAAEQAKAASQQAAEIIGKGQQEAFQSAVGREQEDARRREQAQQAGLTAEQQAAQTQAGAQGQALAAQQAGIGAAQAGGAQQMQAQQQAAGMADVGAGRQMQGLQAQVGATAQGIGMGQQGLEAQRAAAQVGAGQQERALAAQRAAAQAGAGISQLGQQQGFQAAQAGTQLGLAGLQQAGQLGQQGYGTMGRLMGQQQGALGAQGQAFGQMGQMGAQMGQLGTQQQQQAQMEQQLQFQRLQGMEQAGARTQQEQQRDYDIAYQDFQKQQQHPQQQIGWQLGAMQQLPYQSTQVIGDYGQAPSTASDVAGALGAYGDWQSGGDAAAGETAPQPGAEVPQGVTDTTGTDATGTTENPDPNYDPDAGKAVDEYGNPIGRGGGYLSSSGILAPYHKKLIDGLYAGGRINY